ncbi:hypothetical protein HPB50_004220 [Hyalomma asiaticum]|uniref:Uncharacterized protein n=1 Tax=Hyalomma asiaticum TaxID=266040 RepID=A0ACB7T5Z3_HYAAI|nr:hypothetical protein HPB50_004220 [Hyalomma asiaticum]
MESDRGYVEATNRHLKRKLRRSSSVIELNYSTPPSEQAYTIAYVPVAAGNLNSRTRQTLTAYLGRIAPGKTREVRINHRWNILALDVSTRPTLDTLKDVTQLGNIPVRSFTVHEGRTFAGVIAYGGTDIDDNESPSLISSTMHITDIRSLGWSRSRSTSARVKQPLLPEESVRGRIAQETAAAPPDASCLRNTKDSAI